MSIYSSVSVEQPHILNQEVLKRSSVEQSGEKTTYISLEGNINNWEFVSEMTNTQSYYIILF